jgi:hypothetical protein
MTYTVFIKVYSNCWIRNDWPVIVSKLYVKTLNIVRKIVKIMFLCV